MSRLALTPVAHRVASLVAYSVEAASRLSRLVVEASVEAASRLRRGCVEVLRRGVEAGAQVESEVTKASEAGGVEARRSEGGGRRGEKLP